MPSRKPLQPRKYDDSSKKPGRFFPSLTPGKVLLGLVVAGLVTLIGLLIRPRSDLAEIARLQEQAIGLAENWQSAEADAVLQELAKKIPEAPFVLRNLAVVRLNRFDRQNDQQAPQSKDIPTQAPLPPKELAEAIQALLQSQPKDPVSHILASRAARLLRDRKIEIEPPLPEAFESLTRARDLAPSDPAILLEMHARAQEPAYRKDEKVKLVGRAALVDAYHAAPDNLALLTMLLREQADFKSPDPGIVETLEKAEVPLRPIGIIELQLSEGKTGIEKLRREALAAAKLKDWQTVYSRVFAIREAAKPLLITRSDLSRIELDTLEYLRRDLDSKYRAPPPPAPAALPVKFVPATAELALPAVKGVKEVKLCDVDLDGRLDLVVLHGFQLSVFRRGAKDEKWGNELTVSLPPGMEHVIVGDLDRDEARLPGAPGAKQEVKPPGDFQESQRYELSFPDFIVYGSGGFALVRNVQPADSATLNQAGLIDRKLALVMIAEPKVPLKITALLAVDFDHDQDLDLVIATEDSGVHLWRSLGNATFKYMDFSAVSTLPPKGLVFSSLVQVDWDRDLDYDILMCGADQSGKSGPFGYLENLRHGQLRWVSFGKSMERLVGSKSLAVAELDGNISWDVIGTGRQGTRVVLTQTPAAGKVNHIHDITVDSQVGGGVVTWDYDNDSYSDLLVWNSRQPYVYRGLPRGLFQEADLGLPKGLSNGLVALDFGDLDGDGDLDLVLAEPDLLQLHINDGGNQNNWLEIRLAGFVNDQAIGTNNTALGTTVETFFPGRYTAQVVARQPVHIGLGKEEEASLVRFLFSNGVPQASRFSGGNQRYAERQKLFGSCPFIYTWTGEKFEFFTDCLWAAPIGLQVAEGKMAPSRAWEYLLIPGDRLKEHGGTYDLQITEELWEAGYFDRVQLIAVDHPADLDIYSNEKVGPPDIASKRIHTVRQPRMPISAKDQRGRDVLPLLAERDGKFVQLFEKRIWQGLVEEHYLELDLGELLPLPKGEGTRKLTLFLTGWIYPTNTSINVNLSQRTDLAYPKLPSLWVPDGSGGWKLAQGFMGFPGGKTKTMAVEIDPSVFPPGDHRVRMVTSAEIYWDDVFFTVNEPAAELSETPLELASADLHYRGFSKELPREASAPQLYDYAQVSKQPMWSPMQGKFTRYGDVGELLTASDDCMVVLGSGDEMTVRFRAPQNTLPAGWKRDFLLYSVGWDKDCDMNTVHGTHTDPLPYNAMPSYPYPADKPFPQDEKHSDYLRKWQTREQSFKGFWKM